MMINGKSFCNKISTKKFTALKDLGHLREVVSLPHCDIASTFWPVDRLPILFEGEHQDRNFPSECPTSCDNYFFKLYLDS